MTVDQHRNIHETEEGFFETILTGRPFEHDTPAVS